MAVEDLGVELPMLASTDLAWTRATGDVIGDNEWGWFSMVCFVYGREVHDFLQGKVPIGLISSNMGGTCQEHWSGPDAISRVCTRFFVFSAPSIFLKFLGCYYYLPVSIITFVSIGPWPR